MLGRLATTKEGQGGPQSGAATRATKAAATQKRRPGVSRKFFFKKEKFHNLSLAGHPCE